MISTLHCSRQHELTEIEVALFTKLKRHTFLISVGYFPTRRWEQGGDQTDEITCPIDLRECMK